MGRRFLGLTTAARLRVKDCPVGNEYKYRLLSEAVMRRLQKRAPSYDNTWELPRRAMEIPYNLAGTRVNAPLLVLTHHLSPGGALLAALCFVMLMRSKGKRRANLPLRGGKRTKFVGSRKVTENFVRRFPVERRRRQKGCISNRRSLVCMFSLRAKGAVFRFYHKRRPPNFRAPTTSAKQLIKFAALAATTTL